MTPRQIYRYLERLPLSKFVLHGSGMPHRLLLPQVASFPSGHAIHNQLAVYATAVVEIALLYALVGDAGKVLHWQLRRDHLEVAVPSNVRFRSGFVHCLPRIGFHALDPKLPLICVRKTPAMSVRHIPVDPAMLTYLRKTGLVILEYDPQ